MSMKLTETILAASYEYLRATPPFCRWKLPSADDVKFKVARDRSCFGWHVTDGQKHWIYASAALVSHTNTLMQVMAHEMVHLHINFNRVAKVGEGEHGSTFKRLAVQVCRIHGFDPKSF